MKIMNNSLPELEVRQYIKNNGFITIDNLMSIALNNTTDSYYRCIDTIGSDFITAPEISQMFGEIIGLWIIEQYQMLGSPKEILLLELGPGSGVLQRDILKTLQLNDSLFNGLKIYLLDINNKLILQQKKLLFRYHDKIHWIKNIYSLPNIPTIVIANEFLDSMPIKQYIKVGGNYYEMTCGISTDNFDIIYNKFYGEEFLCNRFIAIYPNALDGAIIEESNIALEFVELLSKHLLKNSGSALFIDYGYNYIPKIRDSFTFNNSLQSLLNHQYSPIFTCIGQSDLSAHVDFYKLKQAAMNAGITDILFYTQKDFLIKYGILMRLNKLIAHKHNKHVQDILVNQVKRLISKQYMGELFKILELRQHLL
ncbi:SAM-dependent methyltransferase [Rickettsia endosymbiont of Cardiosporidium cionae]|uniref:SAM-dependent methyltransferase n=1 Tax=Rickettsia endosymbiont of Cardiosporidium cionae TaxID=2777155 RepID=UPI0018942650|nr:SAM-dependent methyltransferase [Rickettsia endosymbiont of Cardiosporidium cionae]KAF8818681.1 class I SAM-dependent methyltransferase [Rickettsia endosymbiont of Cardiosporidium cionae]